MSGELLSSITRETNHYASNFLLDNELAPSSTLKLWPEAGITDSKMWLFIALQFYMGIVKKSVLRDYWVTDSILNTSFPATIMSRNEFLNILAVLHLFGSDEFIRRGNPGYNLCQKLGEFYGTIQAKVGELWTCRQPISVDEGCIPYKGRVHFKCFNPNKPDKYHLKTFKVCDSSNGYCFSCDLYVGAETDEVSAFGKVHDNVLNMLVPFAHLGYSVHMDNFYTLPFLFHHLKIWNILATGTSRNRKGYPKDLWAKKLKEKGDSVSFSYGDQMNLLRFLDRKVVTFLTTEHDLDLIPTGKINFRTTEDITKPKVMHQYNQFMGGVDRNFKFIYGKCIYPV